MWPVRSSSRTLARMAVLAQLAGRRGKDGPRTTSASRFKGCVTDDATSISVLGVRGASAGLVVAVRRCGRSRSRHRRRCNPSDADRPAMSRAWSGAVLGPCPGLERASSPLEKIRLAVLLVLSQDEYCASHQHGGGNSNPGPHSDNSLRMRTQPTGTVLLWKRRARHSYLGLLLLLLWLFFIILTTAHVSRTMLCHAVFRFALLLLQLSGSSARATGPACRLQGAG
jgi:hypothetical protein